ncbi:MAG: hypothetical protein M1816_001519 [Peltula sp. TS41687]|nr:MAG: hypothetical protein M1816_001519 [Peltula sp. TS41687]
MDTRLIIGIDFGTTYSGVAYALTGAPDQVNTIEDWPGATGQAFPKSPTIIKYLDQEHFQWGFEVEPTIEEKITGIKLLLDPDQPMPLYVPPANTQAEIDKLGKSALDVATDYLRAICQHALTKIETRFPKVFYDTLPKEFVLSVPAVWSDRAKDLTLRAARGAGLHLVSLVKEPEAAALFTSHLLKGQGLEVGDAIVICDAGGGTVDLISYEIKNLVPLELKELVPSTALHGIFEPLLLDIKKLVREQVREVDLKRMKDNPPKASTRKAIVLVGGFGSSECLREAIATANPEIQVIQPDTVGTVFSQLPQKASVVCNVAPKHYGVAAFGPYDSSRDLGLPRDWEQWDDVEYQDLLRAQKIELHFTKRFSCDQSQNRPNRHELSVIRFELLECSLNQAPVHPTEGITTINCTLSLDLTTLPLEVFTKKFKASNYLPYWELNFKLLVTIQSGPMFFSLQIGDMEYGRVEAVY